jgi:hypothetical protein
VQSVLPRVRPGTRYTEEVIGARTARKRQKGLRMMDRARNSRPRRRCAPFLILMLATTASLQAQTMPPHSSAAVTPAKPSADVGNRSSPPADVPPTPPLQQPPTQAIIEATPGSLKIDATNASLTQTLQRISEKTGMQLDGLTGDERVFGTFGPGDPRDVLNALLQGTSYNVIMAGTLADGAPRELLLSQKTTTPAGTAAPPPQPTPPAADDDTADVPPDDSQTTPLPGRPNSPGPGGQMQPRNPQELLQQMRQQQQQQQPNQPQ